MKRRAAWHDYSRKGLYLITLVVEGRRPLLGKLTGEPYPHVDLSVLGHRILNQEISKISAFYPNVEVWKAIIMPDHIHIILYVNETFTNDKHLGTAIKGLKTGCRKAYREVYPLATDSMLEKGYNDRILTRPETLESWKRYLDDNPRRLWLKRNNPDLFRVRRNQIIAGVNCEMVGNLFLLEIPDKMAVIVHRCYSDAENGRLHDQWMACGERGGVLVSAAISQKEKGVMREALDKGYRLIYLRDKGFNDFHKPHGEMFGACCRGQLLEISPWEYQNQHIAITRDKCLFLNSMAEGIVMS